jgi:hypothetical protein
MAFVTGRLVPSGLVTDCAAMSCRERFASNVRNCADPVTAASLAAAGRSTSCRFTVSPVGIATGL